MKKCVLLLALASCTAAPVPSEYRQAKIDTGVEKTIQVESHTLHYWDKGSGPAIILLHGLGGSMYDWRFTFEDLVAAGYRVLALDKLGAGYSEKPAEADYSVPADGRRLILFMDALGLKKAHLIGNSFGGGTALCAALTAPERVDRMVLLAAASMPQPYPFYVKLLRVPWISDLAAFAATILPKGLMVRIGLNEVYYDNTKVRNEDVREYAHEYTFSGVSQAMMRAAQGLNVDLAIEYAPQYKKITAPTLILWGDDDEITPVFVGKALREQLQNAKLIIYPECGHTPHMEYPEFTLRRILEFLPTPTAEAGRAALDDEAERKP